MIAKMFRDDPRQVQDSKLNEEGGNSGSGGLKIRDEKENEKDQQIQSIH